MSARLDATILRQIVHVFRSSLDDHREALNRLNVYPVPDGDTGSNMALTLGSVVEELEGAPDDMASVARAVGHGSLMGARGNSGVILSQILRGLTGVLTKAAIAFARDQGGRLLEAYPWETAEEKHPATVYTGLASTFGRLGFEVVQRKAPHKPMMRLALT